MKTPIGSLIRIRFLDHIASIGGIHPPALCTVFGILIGQDKEAFYVASWLTEDNTEENSDSHTIIKSTVKEIKVMRLRGLG